MIPAGVGILCRAFDDAGFKELALRRSPLADSDLTRCSFGRAAVAPKLAQFRENFRRRLKQNP